jgi:hypothetical protein
LPDAAKTLGGNVIGNCEEFYRAIQEAQREEREEREEAQRSQAVLPDPAKKT